AKVTVVEFLPRIVPAADGEIADLLQRSLAKQGLTFHLDTKVTGATVKRGQVKLTATTKGKDVNFEGHRVLVAVGRKPYVGGLGLKEAGVQYDEKTHRVAVNEDFRTNVPGVYAIGDLIDGPMLAHKAEEDAVACVERLAGQKTHVNYATVPGVVYTWPEV